MRINKEKFTFLVAWIISAEGTAYPQSATDHLQRLVEMSAQRVVIAEEVALAKWDSGTPVEDAAREARLIATVVKAGELQGLNQAKVSNFFRAQIEASKLVQYSLLAEWRGSGKAPDHAPVDLAGSIRPELGQLGIELVAELTETANLRASASCHNDVAKA